jgi:glycosyltransferase involved in cell wall biosynthesis
MRLLFLCPDMHRGGAERQWATLIPALAGRGAEVRLVSLYEEGPLFDEVRDAGVPAECLGLRGPNDVRGLRRALAEARGCPGAVVTRTISPQVVGQAIARRAGAAHVFNEHTPLTADGELLAMRPRQWLLTRLVAPHVHRVIEVSDRQRPPLERLGYRSERIVTVPNGVFASELNSDVDRTAMRASLGLEDGDFAVLCVANLRPEKGVDTFVEAVARARSARGESAGAGGHDGQRERERGGSAGRGDGERGEGERRGSAGASGRDGELRGLVAGDGPERARLQRLIAGVAGVELLGSRGDVPDLIVACDAVTLLSEAEALPMSILEAMALGRPVVTSDVGGAGEAVADGESGIVVPAGDTDAAATALANLAADHAAAQAMGERGRSRQRERFDGEAMVDGYWRALEEVATR